MNLLRLDQVDIGASDTVFRQSPTHGMLALGSFAAAAVVVAIAGMAGVTPWPLAGFTIAVLACFALAAGIMVSRSTMPHNWLLAVDGRRLLVNMRSYMNRTFPDPQSRLEYERSQGDRTLYVMVTARLVRTAG